MLEPDIIAKHNLHIKHQDILTKPYFATDLPLWVKNTGLADKLCPLEAKRYLFTKTGKTFGVEITRFLSIVEDRLFYFDSESAQTCLGSCNLENIYMRTFNLDEGRKMLFLSNGVESSYYYFSDSSFFLQNRESLAKYTVQLDFKQQFSIKQELGQGNFATAYKAINKETGQEFTAKFLPLDTPHLIIERELTVLRQLIGAQHVIQYSGVFEDTDCIAILTQYLPGQCLMTVINYSNEISLEDNKTIVSGIAKGLLECHKRHIIHRDIKPQNIVINLETMQPTIIDFGMALNLKKQCQYHRCGTLAYMAPQIYSSDRTCLPYGTKSDLFCLGVIEYIMMMGENPLKGKKGDQYDRSLPVEWNSNKLLKKWGQEAQQMICGLLCEKSTRRWDAQRLLACSFLHQNKKEAIDEDNSTHQDKGYLQIVIQ